MRTFLLALFLFSVQLSFTQDYTSVDSIVNKYPKKFKSIENFAAKISSDFNTDIEKTRAAYYWISNNISYNFYNYHNNINSYKEVYFTKEGDHDTQLKNLQFNYATKCLTDKKAVCEGYSQLLKFTLLELNIKCEVVSGYAKTSIRDIGWVTNETNHAWNAVFIDNKWHLIDTTWSTGNEPNKPNHFNFRDSYFLINPKQLIWSHYPKDKKWQLLDKSISKSAFFYAPIIHVGYYSSQIKLVKMRGILKSRKMIQLSFNTINEDNQYYYQFGEYSLNIEPITFIKKGDFYVAQIPYTNEKGKELLIFNGHKACLSFKVI